MILQITLYPTSGMNNKFKILLAPQQISDNQYIKSTLSSDIYFKNKKSENFIFFSNNLGLAESYNGNLKTSNSFSLGGLNFKGFDYRGIGPFIGNTYLGGNKFFTSTLGYGSSFLFDKVTILTLKFFLQLVQYGIVTIVIIMILI